LAVKFLLHFVGDVHHPLHAADDHDAGGNQKQVTDDAFGAISNLTFPGSRVRRASRARPCQDSRALDREHLRRPARSVVARQSLGLGDGVVGHRLRSRMWDASRRENRWCIPAAVSAILPRQKRPLEGYLIGADIHLLDNRRDDDRAKVDDRKERAKKHNGVGARATNQESGRGRGDRPASRLDAGHVDTEWRIGAATTHGIRRRV
jgi:S1/P1 nuclease